MIPFTLIYLLLAILCVAVVVIWSNRKVSALQRQIIEKEEELELVYVRVREVDQLKSDIVSLAAHQIRSPLVAISGYASMIVEGDFGRVQGQVKSAIKKIADSSENLMAIANEFLDVSHIDDGREKYYMKSFDIKRMSMSVVSRKLLSAKKAKIDLDFSYEKGKDYEVFADEEKIKKVITSLIDNAIRYTKEGWVKVHVEKIDGKIRLSVKDTGVGISHKEIKKLFHKFSRTKEATKIDVAGTGLGLYIAKEMLRAQGGDIWASSDGLGKGSTFTIELSARNDK